MNMAVNHDISFRRRGTVLRVIIPSDLPFDETNDLALIFSSDRGSLDSAELLLRYLCDRHEAAIRAIRKAEWLDGWKAAKSKKRRKATGWSAHMLPTASNWWTA